MVAAKIMQSVFNHPSQTYGKPLYGNVDFSFPRAGPSSEKTGAAANGSGQHLSAGPAQGPGQPSRRYASSASADRTASWYQAEGKWIFDGSGTGGSRAPSFVSEQPSHTTSAAVRAAFARREQGPRSSFPEGSAGQAAERLREMQRLQPPQRSPSVASGRPESVSGFSSMSGRRRHFVMPTNGYAQRSSGASVLSGSPTRRRTVTDDQSLYEGSFVGTTNGSITGASGPAPSSRAAPSAASIAEMYSTQRPRSYAPSVQSMPVYTAPPSRAAYGSAVPAWLRQPKQPPKEKKSISSLFKPKASRTYDNYYEELDSYYADNNGVQEVLTDYSAPKQQPTAATQSAPKQQPQSAPQSAAPQSTASQSARPASVTPGPPVRPVMPTRGDIINKPPLGTVEEGPTHDPAVPAFVRKAKAKNAPAPAPAPAPAEPQPAPAPQSALQPTTTPSRNQAGPHSRTDTSQATASAQSTPGLLSPSIAMSSYQRLPLSPEAQRKMGSAVLPLGALPDVTSIPFQEPQKPADEPIYVNPSQDTQSIHGVMAPSQPVDRPRARLQKRASAKVDRQNPPPQLRPASAVFPPVPSPAVDSASAQPSAVPSGGPPAEPPAESPAGPSAEPPVTPQEQTPAAIPSASSAAPEPALLSASDPKRSSASSLYTDRPQSRITDQTTPHTSADSIRNGLHDPKQPEPIPTPVPVQDRIYSTDHALASNHTQAQAQPTPLENHAFTNLAFNDLAYVPFSQSAADDKAFASHNKQRKALQKSTHKSPSQKAPESSLGNMFKSVVGWKRRSDSDPDSAEAEPLTKGHRHSDQQPSKDSVSDAASDTPKKPLSSEAPSVNDDSHSAAAPAAVAGAAVAAGAAAVSSSTPSRAREPSSLPFPGVGDDSASLNSTPAPNEEARASAVADKSVSPVPHEDVAPLAPVDDAAPEASDAAYESTALTHPGPPEASALGSAKVSAQVPTHTPAQVPAEAPKEAPVEPPTEAFAEAPAEIPVEAPAEAPKEAFAEAPAEVPVEAPPETLAEAPSQAPAEVPTEAPAEAPTEAFAEAPTETLPSQEAVARETEAAPLQDARTTEDDDVFGTPRVLSRADTPESQELFHDSYQFGEDDAERPQEADSAPAAAAQEAPAETVEPVSNEPEAAAAERTDVPDPATPTPQSVGADKSAVAATSAEADATKSKDASLLSPAPDTSRADPNVSRSSRSFLRSPLRLPRRTRDNSAPAAAEDTKSPSGITSLLSTPFAKKRKNTQGASPAAPRESSKPKLFSLGRKQKKTPKASKNAGKGEASPALPAAAAAAAGAGVAGASAPTDPLATDKPQSSLGEPFQERQDLSNGLDAPKEKLEQANAVKDSEPKQDVEAAGEPAQALESEEAIPDPKQALESEEAIPDPKQALESEEAIRDPKQALESEEAIRDPKQALESEEAIRDPKQALESEEAIPDPKQALEETEAAPAQTSAESKEEFQEVEDVEEPKQTDTQDKPAPSEPTVGKSQVAESSEPDAGAAEPKHGEESHTISDTVKGASMTAASLVAAAASAVGVASFGGQEGTQGKPEEQASKEKEVEEPNATHVSKDIHEVSQPAAKSEGKDMGYADENEDTLAQDFFPTSDAVTDEMSFVDAGAMRQQMSTPVSNGVLPANVLPEPGPIGETPQTSETEALTKSSMRAYVVKPENKKPQVAANPKHKSLFKRKSTPALSSAKEQDARSGSVHLEHVGVPAVREPTDVLVQVFATSIDAVDAAAMRAHALDEKPFVPGRSFCGRILELGPKAQIIDPDTSAPLGPGALVFGLVPPGRSGALAERFVVPAPYLARTPQYLSPEEAACLPAMGAVVVELMEKICAELPTGGRIFILGGDEAAGNMCMQFAFNFRASQDLWVVSSCSPSLTDGVAFCKSTGASEVLVGELHEALAKAPKASYDLVIDAVGSPEYLDGARALLKDNGVLVSVARSSGLSALPENFSFALPKGESKSKVFPRLGKKTARHEFSSVRVHNLGASLATLTEAVEVGGARPPLRRVYTFDSASAAFETTAAGKVVRIA